MESNANRIGPDVIAEGEGGGCCMSRTRYVPGIYQERADRDTVSGFTVTIRVKYITISRNYCHDRFVTIRDVLFRAFRIDPCSFVYA